MKLIGFTPAWRGGWTWKCCWQLRPTGRGAEKKREGCPRLKSHQTVLVHEMPALPRPCASWVAGAIGVRVYVPPHQARKRYLPCFRLCPPCFQSTPYQPSQKREASFATDGLIIAGMLFTMAAMVVPWAICMRLFRLPDWFVVSPIFFYKLVQCQSTQ